MNNLLGAIQCLVVLDFETQIGSAAAEEFKTSYSPEETLALQNFRILVNDVLVTESTKSNEFLIRWIRDSNFDLEKANQKLRKSIDWKRSIQINNLNVKDLNQSYPIHLTGYDHTGSPIYEFRGATVPLRKLALAGKRISVNRHMDAWMELGLKHTDNLRKQGENVTQWIMVIDIAGFNLREHGCLRCLPFYLGMINDYENYYCQTTKHIVAINMPRIFQGILVLTRPFQSPATRKGLKTFDSNKAEWQNWFLSIADPSQLRIKFGGTQTSFTNFEE